VPSNGSSKVGRHGDVVVRKAEHGWVVGNESVSDLTSAMVLADLFAADRASSGEPGPAGAPDETAAVRRPAARQNESGPQAAAVVPLADDEVGEAARLAVTVSQLEHSLASRVRVEQAIGVLAERHRLRPRDAFDLLRKAARVRGRRVAELAQEVVASAANPLLHLPEELSRRQPEGRPRGRSARRGRHAADR
jgi:hypothetical protein